MDEEIPLESNEPNTSLTPLLCNILAMFFLFLACLCPGFSALIFAAPDFPLNPLPPGGFGKWSPTPTSTQTPVIYYPETWTPSPSQEQTIRPSRTPPPITPTITLYYDPDNPNPGSTSGPFFPFIVESGHPEYSPSPQGCAWMGIAGTVTDSEGSPINNLLVVVRGDLAGNAIDVEQITGSISEERIGEYEITLADDPIYSINNLSIQLLDGDRIAISKQVFFNTFAGCDRNLITLNFVQNTS
jgi:hypothetical protein